MSILLLLAFWPLEWKLTEGLSFSVKKQANQVKQKTQPTQNRSPVEGLNQKKEIYRIGFGKDDSK